MTTIIKDSKRNDNTYSDNDVEMSGGRRTGDNERIQYIILSHDVKVKKGRNRPRLYGRTRNLHLAAPHTPVRSFL